MPLDDKTPLPLQEALHLVKLAPEGGSRRYMGTRAAYLPGGDIAPEKGIPLLHKAAFGGHVYGQGAWAVARTQRELEDEAGRKPSERLGLHVSPFFHSHTDNCLSHYGVSVFALTRLERRYRQSAQG